MTYAKDMHMQATKTLSETPEAKRLFKLIEEAALNGKYSLSAKSEVEYTEAYDITNMLKNYGYSCSITTTELGNTIGISW